MPWHNDPLRDLTRHRGPYGPATAAEALLRAKVDACPHKRASRIGRSACLHCRDCRSTFLPPVPPPSTGPVSATLHSTPGSAGVESPRERWDREEREEDAVRAEGLAAQVEDDVAPPGEKTIVDRGTD